MAFVYEREEGMKEPSYTLMMIHESKLSERRRCFHLAGNKEKGPVFITLVGVTCKIVLAPKGPKSIRNLRL